MLQSTSAKVTNYMHPVVAADVHWYEEQVVAKDVKLTCPPLHFVVTEARASIC